MTLYTEHVDNKNDEYPTKPELWRPISDAVGGFDLDPAAGCEPESIGEEHYTKEDNGLDQPWFGKVWLNPPFSNKEQWYKKIINERNAGNVKLCVALAPVDVSTDWFHRWFGKANVICWLNGRDWYLRGNSPSFATSVGVFGDPPDALLEVLDSKGLLTTQFKMHKQQTLF